MTDEGKVCLQNIAFICFASTLKGTFIFKNFKGSTAVLNLVEILQNIGEDITIEKNTITLKSNGALHLFEPKKPIDVKGSEVSLYALCGLFAPYDYNVFFEDSTSKLKSHQFHSIILGFYEAGIHFNYSTDFTLPFSMKGNSNFLPMKHEIITQNPLLELAFFILGLQGFAKTTIYSSHEYGFKNILQALNANFKSLDDGAVVSLHSQNFTQITEIDITNYE